MINPESLYPQVKTLTALLLEAARRFEKTVALFQDGKSWSYAEVCEQGLRYAAALKSIGLEPGDRVALFMENSPEYVGAYFGTFMANGIAVPIDARTDSSGLHMLLKDCEPKCLLVSPLQLNRLKKALPLPVQLAACVMPQSSEEEIGGTRVLSASDFNASSIVSEIDSDSPAVINYTSGSSGTPKGVVVSHRAILANTRSIVSYLNLQPVDRVMQILPFSYCYGASLLHTHFLVGGSVVIDNRFLYPSAVVENMKLTRCTGFAGVPSSFHTLAQKCNLKKNLYPELRYMTQAGGPMRPELVETIRENIAPAQLYIMYGQTEATARLTYLEPDRWVDKRGSVGKPIPGVRLRIVSEEGKDLPNGMAGEVWASGENLMTGYWGRPEDTAQVLKNGWLRTGDLGVLDDEGFLFIKGRLRDFIKTSGYRVSPREIEEALGRHPALEECVVLGLPDEQLGEKIAAVVSLKPGIQVTQVELQLHCKALLAPHKIPRQFAFLPEIPKSNSGKVQREAILSVLNLPTTPQGATHVS